MATAVLIPIDQYLSTTYRPDREYIDGEVLERNMGKWEHARIQSLLAIWFGQHEQQWHIQVATEWRTRVSSSRVRIPDLVLVAQGPQTDILTHPPILIVEILSPDDTFSDLQKRADDYLRMGAETIWIIDPATRTARICSDATWVEATRLTVANTHIYLELATLFASLDRSNSSSSGFHTAKPFSQVPPQSSVRLP